jgi:hypothetical protein
MQFFFHSARSRHDPANTLITILVHGPGEARSMTYLRMTIGRWNIDLNTPEGKDAFSKILNAGISVFHRQPGFIQYRLMMADAGPRSQLQNGNRRNWESRVQRITGTG